MAGKAETDKFVPLWKILQSDTNDVYLCLRRPGNFRCLVWIIRDRGVTRMLLRETGAHPWGECFPAGEYMGMELPWEEKRPLKRFWNPQKGGRGERERICREIISLSITSHLPGPLLYRVLEEEKIQIRKDGTLYFSYDFSLDGLRPGCTEQECVQVCARILRQILAQGDKKERRLAQLLEKKLARDRYPGFLELYRDFRRPAKHRKKKLSSLPEKWKKRLFRTAAVCAGLLLIITVVLFVSQLAFGQIPFLNLFQGPLEQIGTETLGRLEL